MTEIHKNQLSNLFAAKAPELLRLEKWRSRQPYRFFYRGFLPKSAKRRHIIQAGLAQQAQVSRQQQVLLDAGLPALTINAKKQLPDEKIIWQYWGQGVSDMTQLPEIVQLCFNSIDRHKGDCRVIRLDDDSIHDYLDIPAFVTEKRKNPEFRHVFFSDLLRSGTFEKLWRYLGRCGHHALSTHS